MAQHRRDRVPNGYTTLAEHMPSHHRWYAEWSAEKFQSWAATMGPETAEVIAKVLACRGLPTPGVSQLSGHPESGPPSRIRSSEQGLRQGAACGHPILHTHQNMLALGLEEGQPAPSGPDPAAAHENVRGRAVLQLRTRSASNEQQSGNDPETGNDGHVGHDALLPSIHGQPPPQARIHPG